MVMIGVLLIVIGFLLRLNPVGVVLFSGVVTGLIGGMSLNDILTTLGSAFHKSRYIQLFIIVLPVIALLERFGLKERVAYLIGKAKGSSASMILAIYTVGRTISAAMGLRLGGHVQFVRPLVYPMIHASTKNRYGKVSDEMDEEIKAYGAASDNYGNFFGQNVFIAASGVLLVMGTLEGVGYKVVPVQTLKASVAVAVISVFYSTLQFYKMEKRLARMSREKEGE